MLRKLAFIGSLACTFALVATSSASAEIKDTVTAARETPAPSTGAVPGNTLRVINVPVPSPSCCGIGICVDCDGNLYYTNSFEPVIRKMDAFGVLIGTIPLTHVDGSALTLGAISWDDNRQMIWGGTDQEGAPAKVYLVDPVTGVGTLRFTTQSGGFGFIDGIGYDATDDSVWVSDDVSTVIDHHSATTGLPLPGSPLTPLNAGGSPLGSISGVIRGVGDQLYLGQNGLGQIVRVRASDGGFLGTFASPGGRDEDLECDAINFFPTLALWSKDAYNNQVTAIEVEPGTCACAGQQNNPPQFTSNVCGTTIMASAGVPVSYVVSAGDIDPGDIVTLTAANVPAGMTHAPALPAMGNPVSTTANWTPGGAQIGLFTITYTATDDNMRSSTCVVNILVAECHLLVGTGGGNTSVNIFGHLYDTQLNSVRSTYPVTMDDIPSFPVPHGHSNGGGPNFFKTAMSVQVVMYNPDIFPNNPTQWSQRMQVNIDGSGAILPSYYGTSNGITIQAETFVDGNGLTRMRFPFVVAGM
jgi:hypothetical protein